MCEPFQEMILDTPIELIEAIRSCEVLALGFKIQKEATILKNQAGEDSNEAVVRFRMQISVHPELVEPEQTL